MLQGDVTITTIDLACVKIMSVKLHAEYIILWALLCASFALFSQKLREWQHQSAYFLNTPRMSKEALAIRRIFSLVDMITNTKFSNCPNMF